MSLPEFDLHRPSTLEDALAVRSEDVVAHAGGTELLLAMRMGLLRPDALVDLKRIPELANIEHDGAHLRIGAACTHDDVARSPVVLEHLPRLAEIARHVGNPRVRAQGTISGNLVFAEPKSDILPTLIALDATLEIRSSTQVRHVRTEEFVLGAYWTDIGDDELLVEVSIPMVAGRRLAYVKYQTMERPTVGIALREDADGSHRVVVAAVCGEPLVVDVPDRASIDPVAIAAEVDVVPDLTGGDRYKRHITSVMISRAMEQLDRDVEEVS